MKKGVSEHITRKHCGGKPFPPVRRFLNDCAERTTERCSAFVVERPQQPSSVAGAETQSRPARVASVARRRNRSKPVAFADQNVSSDIELTPCDHVESASTHASNSSCVLARSLSSSSGLSIGSNSS